MKHEQLLSKLVEIKSYSGEEEKIRGYIADWFKERKIPVLVQGDNLVIHLNGQDRSRAFIMNSHMDTVSAGKSAWKYGAWTPTMEGKKMIGLGISDMKSGIASSMLLAESMYNSGAPVDMFFTYVVNEEVDGSGTESFAQWFEDQGYTKKYTDKAGIFTEPTSMTEIQHGHRGNLFLIAKAEGPSGHSSRPDKIDENQLAVFKLVNFAHAFREAAESWNREFPNEYFKPAITVGLLTSIEAGRKVVKKKTASESSNKFPSLCIGTFDFRTTPEFHEEALKRIQGIAEKMDIKIELEYPAAPAGFTDKSERIIKVAKAVVKKPKLKVTLGSADLGFLSGKGVNGIILGPGEEEQSHKVNEFCYPIQIIQGVEIYRQIVEAWAK